MEDDIRALLLKYGIVEVHESLKRVCERMYWELGQIYGPTTNIDSVVKVCAVIPESNSIEEAPSPPPEFDEEPITEPEAEEESEEETVKEVVLPKRVIKKKKTEQEQVVVVPLNELVKSVEDDDTWTTEQKRIKDKHRKTIQDKFDELSAKGVDPNALLTKENLEGWLKEGKSYNCIARDVGLHESVVSKTAKEFGLESKVNRGELMRWVTRGRSKKN
jgi:outer membrane biosynthesis protein TonB